MRENNYLSDQDITELKDKITQELNLINERHQETANVGSMAKEELSDPVDEANSNIQVSHDLRMKNRESFYFKNSRKVYRKFLMAPMGFAKNVMQK